MIRIMEKPPKNILSKPTFIKGCQCPNILWLNKFQPELKTPINSQLQAIFYRETNVRKLAEKLIPGGVDTRPDKAYSFQKSVVDTLHYIEQGNHIIYEAALQCDQVLSALDILVIKVDLMVGFYKTD